MALDEGAPGGGAFPRYVAKEGTGGEDSHRIGVVRIGRLADKLDLDLAGLGVRAGSEKAREGGVVMLRAVDFEVAACGCVVPGTASCCAIPSEQSPEEPHCGLAPAGCTSGLYQSAG